MTSEKTAREMIDDKIRDLDDWRDTTLDKVRRIIKRVRSSTPTR